MLHGHLQTHEIWVVGYMASLLLSCVLDLKEENMKNSAPHSPIHLGRYRTNPYILSTTVLSDSTTVIAPHPFCPHSNCARSLLRLFLTYVFSGGLPQ